MKSNVCNSLNYSAQYWASWLTIKDLYLYLIVVTIRHVLCHVT